MDPDAALAAALTRRGWIYRHDGTRIVTVTPAGCTALDAWLGTDLSRSRATSAA